MQTLGEPRAAVPEGKARAGCPLPPAACQAAMVRFRQGRRGQASWVPSQEPVCSQLTMATWAAVAEQSTPCQLKRRARGRS